MARRLIVRPLAEADLENAARMMTAGRKRRTDGPPSHGCVVCCGVAVFSSSVVSAGAGLQFFRAVNLAQIAVECAERPMTGLSGDFEKEAISKATVIERDSTRAPLGGKNALGYLIGEKLMPFAEAAKDNPAFEELSEFSAARLGSTQRARRKRLVR